MFDYGSYIPWIYIRELLLIKGLQYVVSNQEVHRWSGIPDRPKTMLVRRLSVAKATFSETLF